MSPYHSSCLTLTRALLGLQQARRAFQRSLHKLSPRQSSSVSHSKCLHFVSEYLRLDYQYMTSASSFGSFRRFSSKPSAQNDSRQNHNRIIHRILNPQVPLSKSNRDLIPQFILQNPVENLTAFAQIQGSQIQYKTSHVADAHHVYCRATVLLPPAIRAHLRAKNEFSVTGYGVAGNERDARFYACASALAAMTRLKIDWIKWMLDQGQNVAGDASNDVECSGLGLVDQLVRHQPRGFNIFKIKQVMGYDGVDVVRLLNLVSLDAPSHFNTRIYIDGERFAEIVITATVTKKQGIKLPLYQLYNDSDKKEQVIKVVGKSPDVTSDIHVLAKGLRQVKSFMVKSMGLDKWDFLLSHIQRNPNLGICALQIEMLSSEYSSLESLLNKFQRHQNMHRQRKSTKIDRMRSPYYEKMTASYPFAKLTSSRPELALPIHQIQDSLIDALERKRVVILQGGTGSGKTRGVPQMLLNHAIMNETQDQVKIMVTQPRRIAAVSAAQIVAKDRGCQLGDSGCPVGFHIRADKVSPMTKGSIEFVTPGIAVRRVMQEINNKLISHLIIDEVHEREKDIDLLLIALKSLLRDLDKNHNFRLILMSATINTDKLCTYFDDCEIINAPTSTRYNVQEVYLNSLPQLFNSFPAAVMSRPLFEAINKVRDSENMLKPLVINRQKASSVQNLIPSKKFKLFSEKNPQMNAAQAAHDASIKDLAAQLIAELVHRNAIPPAGQFSGSLLCFLPGLEEIFYVYKRLMAMFSARMVGSLKIHMLHSSLPMKYQEEIFAPAKLGTAKIILATNIAESSITVKDVTVVVDSGRSKEHIWYPENHMYHLARGSCAKASAIQRLGRAGRIREGLCIRLFSRDFYELMPDTITPEMLRSSLKSLVLNSKLLSSRNAENFLCEAMDSPEKERVSEAVKSLANIGAIRMEGNHETLTPLGEFLAYMPVDPHVGKMVLLGIALKSSEFAITLAACLTNEDLVKKSINKSLKERSESDLVTGYDMFVEWMEKKKRQGIEQAKIWCRENGVSYSDMERMAQFRHQLRNLLVKEGFPIMDQEYDRRRGDGTVEKVLACAASPFLSLSVDGYEHLTKSKEPAFIHPHSRLFGEDRLRKGGAADSAIGYGQWHACLNLTHTTKTYLSGATRISPLYVGLFGGENVSECGIAGSVIDGWIMAKGQVGSWKLLKSIREELDQCLLDMCSNPGARLPASFDRMIDGILSMLQRSEAMEARQERTIKDNHNVYMG